MLAIAHLVDCHPATGCCAPWGEQANVDAPVYHLVLDGVRRLDATVPALGRLGLWVWTASPEAAE